MNKMIWPNYLNELKSKNFYAKHGRLTRVSNLVVEAVGLNGFVGELCKIKSTNSKSVSFQAEIVGLRDQTTLLMPYGETKGIDLGSEIEPTGDSIYLQIGEGLLGRVIDPFGSALDGFPLKKFEEKIAIRGKCHNPMSRKDITSFLETGVRAIDSFFPIGKGQRIGIFAGSGVGKSTLLGMIARHSKSDVNVIALIGERGREVKEFINKTLGKEGLAKSIIVVATSDQPALVRELAAHTATAIAEYFCEKNKEVMLIMDSVTRFAMAHREIGLSIGEPATARGYTPSAFGALPKLVERAGSFEGRGSITGIYTVLVEGDDFHEPVSDHMRAILDGHILLSRELANHGHYPAIALLESISRLAPDLWTKHEKELMRKIMKLVSIREKHKDMIEIGAYKAGTNAELDIAIAMYPELESFLVQDVNEIRSRAENYQSLIDLSKNT